MPGILALLATDQKKGTLSSLQGKFHTNLDGSPKALWRISYLRRHFGQLFPAILHGRLVAMELQYRQSKYREETRGNGEI